MWKYDELFAPMKIGSCAVKNRYVMEPMGPAGLADSSGAFNDKAIAFYTERAKGRCGTDHCRYVLCRKLCGMACGW